MTQAVLQSSQSEEIRSIVATSFIWQHKIHAYQLVAFNIALYSSEHLNKLKF